MIKIENLETWGFAHAMRGMRNPMNSWHKNDTKGEVVGENDLDLAHRLAVAGTEHRKYARQIFISMDITAPLYWWKEYDTYKVGTTANSTSTMHKITSRKLTLDDFSLDESFKDKFTHAEVVMNDLIDIINLYIGNYNSDKFGTREMKPYLFRTIIQLLPSSYNQKRTVTLDYEVAYNIYKQRQNHKLSEWHEFCDVLADMPYFREIFEV